MNLVLLGAPGSGKGTQAEILARNFSLRPVSVGDILREEVKKNSSLGQEVNVYMQKGVLVPDEIIGKVIELYLDRSKGFVLDGFPRNLAQAKMLGDILTDLNKRLTAVIYFDISREKIIERLSGRRICKKCGAIYHIKNMPSQKEGICDRCGGELVRRSDDNEETINKRWEVFWQLSAPLIDYYKDKGLLLTVDASKEKEAVFDEIAAKIKEYDKDKVA